MTFVIKTLMTITIYWCVYDQQSIGKDECHKNQKVVLNKTALSSRLCSDTLALLYNMGYNSSCIQFIKASQCLIKEEVHIFLFYCKYPILLL